MRTAIRLCCLWLATAVDLRALSERRLELRQACALAPPSSPPPASRAIVWWELIGPAEEFTRFVRPDHVVDGWELYGIAKCGSSSLRWYCANTAPGARSAAPRGGCDLPQCAVEPPKRPPPTRQISFVRDPLDRFVSGALELMYQRSGPIADPSGIVDRAIGPFEARRAQPMFAADGALSAAWAGHVSRFAGAFLRGAVGFRSIARGGGERRSKTLSIDPHLRPQFEALEMLPALAHLGGVGTMFEELDSRFGTESARQKANGTITPGQQRARSRHQQYDVSAMLTPRTLRGLCEFYLADVCCFEAQFARRCEAVGVSCHANRTYARRGGL